MVCDNNLIAASKRHLTRVVDSLKQYRYVDFNQGFEARLFTPDKADLFGQLRCKIRFALDTMATEAHVKDALDLCRERATNDVGVFCLIGFNDTPETAQAKLELIRSWGVWPTPMRFQPLDAAKKNDHLAPGWTEKEMKRMMRYYSRLVWFHHIPYEEFSVTEQGALL